MILGSLPTPPFYASPETRPQIISRQSTRESPSFESSQVLSKVCQLLATHPVDCPERAGSDFPRSQPSSQRRWHWQQLSAPSVWESNKNLHPALPPSGHLEEPPMKRQPHPVTWAFFSAVIPQQYFRTRFLLQIVFRRAEVWMVEGEKMDSRWRL